MMIHGHAANQKKTSTYRIWGGMKARCTNPSEPAYKHYGGRGIAVCERWMNFPNFLADMGERPSRMSIDRIDNDGNYEPGNCRWATFAEQALNRSNNRLITAFGKTQPMKVWCEEYSIDSSTLERRLDRGVMSAEDAVSRPVDDRFWRSRLLRGDCSYDALDAAILANVRRVGRARFSDIDSGDAATEVRRLAEVTGRNTRKIFDCRLDNLKKQKSLKCESAWWTIGGCVATMVCEWGLEDTASEFSGLYYTGCGVYKHDNVKHGYNFCPYCGKPIQASS